MMKEQSLMSKAAKTRLLIIKKTASLFNKKGYSGTSLADISRVTGLTKGSVYGNFADKDEVALEVYRYSSGVLSRGLEQAWACQSGAAAKMRAMTDFYRMNWKRIFKDGGCPLLNTAAEADDNHPALRHAVRESFSGWALRLTAVISAGMTSGEFRLVDAEAYAYLFISMLEGGILLAKITGCSGHLFRILDRIDQITEYELADPCGRQGRSQTGMA